VVESRPVLVILGTGMGATGTTAPPGNPYNPVTKGAVRVQWRLVHDSTRARRSGLDRSFFLRKSTADHIFGAEKKLLVRFDTSFPSTTNNHKT